MRPSVIMALSGAFLVPCSAQAESLSLADSFRIGNAGVLCTAQSQIAAPALSGMFDRAYRIVCRDAAAPVGNLYALRHGAPALAADCAAPAAVNLPGLPGVLASHYTVDGLSRLRYEVQRGLTLFVADGFAGYGSALALGLQSLLADATVSGVVDVAATEAGDPAAFARLQAGGLEPDQALAEAYNRNNAGSYAESAEFFDSLLERSRQGAAGFSRGGEYLANKGLQQSNLGQFAEADRLFLRAAQTVDGSDPMSSRLLRNARVQHLLNRRQNQAALAELARPVAVSIATTEAAQMARGFINTALSQRLNTDDAAMRGLNGAGMDLTVTERMQILDAQALYLQGVAQAALLSGEVALRSAQAQLASLRGGRVLSILWLRAAVATELAQRAERRGRLAEARAAFAQATQLTQAQHSRSAALLSARARQAAFLARTGNVDAAASMFRDIVRQAPNTAGAGQVLGSLLAPWFAQLVAKGDAAAASDLFDASQILQRPGVAQTQAILARELSGGSDEAASLFRQSITLSRDIVRTEGEIARLAQIDQPLPEEAALLSELRAHTAIMGRDQTAILARLAEYPRFRSVSNGTVTLANLQSKLKPGEAYYKLIVLDEDAYALVTGQDDVAIFKLPAKVSELGHLVKSIRDTVVVFDNGRPTTYPFDAAAARRLYGLLMGPDGGSAARLVTASRHLIVEPDGALLQLPFNLLISSDDNLAAYQMRQADEAADAFDARGLAWLGRDRMISTATSPRAFLDVRSLPGSRGGKAYLGLGENVSPVRASGVPARGGAGIVPALSNDCDWPLLEWTRPVSSSELKLAARLLAGGGSAVSTGASFSDSGVIERADLKDYRVIHFATHGLVTAPRPECPARPALLTSFGTGSSDGLLSFREIFDLHLDADTIILSACDTAGAATASATREAGITTGGNVALDGLVRAFVGSGARAVIASHWPVPDSFDATTKLITGLFADAGQLSVGEALRRSQVAMMTAAETSHPYYWSGFAIIGDASKPLLSQVAAAKHGR